VASSEGNDRVSVTTALPGRYTLQLLHQADGEAGLLAADTAMYGAKDAGRGRFLFHQAVPQAA
jgi:hypothetical protein